MSSHPTTSDSAITEVTRRAILDSLVIEGISWCGDMDEVEFLSRIYNLARLPSYDGRFTTAADDIWQHRVNNYDWEPNWVFTDDRFELSDGSDEQYLRFLSEMVHPAVCRDKEKAAAIVQLLNGHLAPDGWELAQRMTISGRPVYAARRILDGKFAISTAKTVANVINGDYMHRQITRLEAAIDSDPDLAIGTAKEFVETVCKTILDERKVAFDTTADFPKLVRAALKELKLVPDELPESAKASDSVRLILNNLASVSNGMAELRNRMGTGHGRHATTKVAHPRHARLAVGAAVTLAVFLFETHQERGA
ncbi:MAG: abortive infection family protein [Planctomycetaceae bacterium]|nr:abortive infection family protein [Planctomycetaceae bacterium]